MPRLVIRLGGRPSMSWPAKRTAPDAGTRPVMALHSVDLPMPLRPTTASTPRSRENDTPCRTCARPKWTSRFSTWRIGPTPEAEALPPNTLGAMAAPMPAAAHIDGLDFGIVLDFVGRAVLEHPAIVQDRHPLDDTQGDVEVLPDRKVANGGGESRQQSHQFAALAGRQPGGGLVEQIQARRAGRRHADLELAQLAVRQLRDQPLGQMREAGAFEQVLRRHARGMAGARPDETEAAAADAAGREEKIVPDREVAEQQGGLVGAAQAAADPFVGRQFGDVFAEEPDAPRCGGGGPRGRGLQPRLSGARGAAPRPPPPRRRPPPNCPDPPTRRAPPGGN